MNDPVYIYDRHLIYSNTEIMNCTYVFMNDKYIYEGSRMYL